MKPAKSNPVRMASSLKEKPAATLSEHSVGAGGTPSHRMLMDALAKKRAGGDLSGDDHVRLAHHYSRLSHSDAFPEHQREAWSNHAAHHHASAIDAGHPKAEDIPHPWTKGD